MDTLSKTGVPIKSSGDSLSHQDINNINSTVNTNVTVSNYLLKNFCNLNDEVNDYSREFSLRDAINTVPISRRKPGMKIRFLSGAGIYSEYIYSGDDSVGSWTDENNWDNVSFNIIDGGEW